MRHFLANVAIYTISAVLIGAAALFGWIRSAQLTITNEQTMLARHLPAPAIQFEWESLGERAYVANCQNCHGAEGEGWDQYPGLQRTAELLAAPGGRAHVRDLHLHGLASPRWRAPMPPMGHMQDAELAAVINYVLTRFGNRGQTATAELFVPAEIAEGRGTRLTPHQVNESRPPSAQARGWSTQGR